MKTILLIVSLVAIAGLTVAAAPLSESTFTEIIREVSTLSADGTPSPADVNEILKAPTRVRTGPESRAELTAPDHTITRVGANTVFAFFDKTRALGLEQGNVLFHAPKGLGGGTIISGGASAAVLGTTLIVSASADGGFKVILLEGRGKVALPNGNSATLKAGQEVFVLPGGETLSGVLNISLGKLVQGSQLVNGFTHELTSLPLIHAAIKEQNAALASGKATDTGLPPEFFIPPPMPGNGLDVIDPASYQTAVHQPLTPGQFASFFGTPNPKAGPVQIGAPGGRGVVPIGFHP
jgi:FecR protein